MGTFQDASGLGLFTVPGDLDAYMLSRGHSLLEVDPTPAAFQALRGMFEFYGTGNSGELVTELPITNTKYVVLSIAIPAPLKVGDVLWCMADFQVTNDETYNALCGSQLIAADTATGTAGTEISEATGTNVTPDNHHMAFSRTGMLVVATPARRFVNLVVYAGASNAQPGDVMTVDADYGRLNVMRVKV